MSTRVEVDRRRSRDELILRLRERGWSLRRIARDPRVRLTHQGVARALERLGIEPSLGGGPAGHDDLALVLYRGTHLDGDPEAAQHWRWCKTRAADLMARWAVERHGQELDALDFTSRQILRTQANRKAITETAKRVLS